MRTSNINLFYKKVIYKNSSHPDLLILELFSQFLLVTNLKIRNHKRGTISCKNLLTSSKISLFAENPEKYV